MKKLIVSCGVALTALLLVATGVGCGQPPSKLPPKPAVGIMVPSDTVEAGSSFWVMGRLFQPNQKVRAGFEWRTRDSKGGTEAYGQADENGFILLGIKVPKYGLLD